MEIFIGIITFVLGTCCGSFVNMLVFRTAARYRLLRRKAPRNDVGGRSFCDFCGKQLSWYENIPVISWMSQKGKSRCCGKRLPYQYPVVEIITGILFLIFNLKFLIFNQFLMIKFLIILVIVTLLVFSAVFDLKYMILPNFSTYILIVLAAITTGGWLAGAGAGLFIWGLTKLKIKGKQAMGEGDALLAVFMGLWLGWPKIILAFYMAFIIGAILGIILMIRKKKKGDDQIPFGPFLIGATMATYLIGDELLYYVNRWF